MSNLPAASVTVVEAKKLENLFGDFLGLAPLRGQARRFSVTTGSFASSRKKQWAETGIILRPGWVGCFSFGVSRSINRQFPVA
jgi:hypothetical protein